MELVKRGWLRPIVVILGSLTIGLACSQLPLPPGARPIRPGWDLLVVVWGVLNSVLSIPVVSVAVGGLIGGLISLYFSKQGSRDLRRAAAGLRDQSERLLVETRLVRELLNKLAFGLAQAGQIDATFDEQGQLRGINLYIRPAGAPSSEAAGAGAFVITPPDVPASTQSQ